MITEMKKMNDRHRAVMQARIRYERRKYEHDIDGFVKALYPVFKAAATTMLPRLNNGLPLFRETKSAPDEGHARGTVDNNIFN